MADNNGKKREAEASCCCSLILYLDGVLLFAAVGNREMMFGCADAVVLLWPKEEVPFSLPLSNLP